MAEEMGERTEQPTGRKLGEARSQGNVAKSQDLASAIDLIGATLILVTFGGTGVAVLTVMMRRMLEDQTAGPALDADSLWSMTVWAGSRGVMVVGPVLIGMFLLAGAAHMVQIGLLFTTRPITPNITRLNPVAGVKKLFNLRSLVKTSVNTVKIAVVSVLAYLVISRHLPSIAALPELGAAAGLYKVALMALELAAWLLAIFLAIGLIDYFYQRWQHTKDLRMTRQEVKDERRSVEGDPDVKSRRFRMAREIAMQRLQQAVPQADVIVTNPTHFSVALKYDQDRMKAPRVIAKGADLLAFNIRNLATAHGVPIVERPPLARGLYWGVDVGREISPEFYEAVAEVLAYVYRIKGRAA
jgi:flagellar biosynthesis protein FlhB